MVLKCEFWKKKFTKFIFVKRFIESHSRPIKAIKKSIIRVKFSFKLFFSSNLHPGKKIYLNRESF